MKVKTFKQEGVEVEIILNDRGIFCAYVDDIGKIAEATTLAELEKRARREAKKMTLKIAIPCTVMSKVTAENVSQIDFRKQEDEDDNPLFVDVNVTGQHSRTGKLIVETSTGDSYDFGGRWNEPRMLRRLTTEERQIASDMMAALYAAEKALETWAEERRLDVRQEIARLKTEQRRKLASQPQDSV